MIRTDTTEYPDCTERKVRSDLILLLSFYFVVFYSDYIKPLISRNAHAQNVRNVYFFHRIIYENYLMIE